MIGEAELERRLREWLWFVLAVGVALRLIGLDWDRSLIFNPDEGNIGRAAAALSFPDRLVSDFSAYNGLALYLPRLLAELIAPIAMKPGAAPDGIIFAGRILSAVCACLTLPIIADIARRLWNREAALFATALAAFTPALIQSAHFATTESALILCLAVLLWLTLMHTGGRLPLGRYGALVGLVLGVGFGFKTTALAFAVIPAVAVLQTSVFRGRFLAALGSGAIAVLIVAVIGLITTPQLWVTPAAYFATMRFEGGVVAGTEDVFWTYQFANRIPGLFELLQLPWILGPAFAVLAVQGLPAALYGMARLRPAALSLAPTIGFTLVYSIVIGSWYAKFVRYEYLLLPALLLLAVYAAMLVPANFWRRALMLSTVLVTLVVGALQMLVYLNPDPRIAGWEWLKPQLRGGDNLVIEPVEVGPSYWHAATPITTAVLPLIEPEAPGKSARLADILADGDWMIIASRRHHSVLPRLQERFPQLCSYYEALWSGDLGYEVVGRFTRRPPLPVALLPEVWAEETFTVFDSPELFVLRNTGHLPATALLARIDAPSVACAAGTLPVPPR